MSGKGHTNKPSAPRKRSTGKTRPSSDNALTEGPDAQPPAPANLHPVPAPEPQTIKVNDTQGVFIAKIKDPETGNISYVPQPTGGLEIDGMQTAMQLALKLHRQQLGLD